MMIPPPIPPDEAARLRVLRTYGILETPPEAAFDDVAKLAAQVCDAPIALVTLIDEKREWFKASVGVDLVEATREGFCSYTILGRELLVIPDAHADPRFAENPYVLGPPRVRSYAGAPLITPDGPVIGTLCVLDYVPRIFTPEHGLALVRLARQVQTHLELRRALRIAHEAEGALRAAVLRSIDHEHALIGLTRTCLEAGSLDEAFRVIVRKVSETLQVERVNLWRFNPPRSGIVCVAHYQAGTGAYSSGMELESQAYPSYFDALEKEPVIAADDARTDPRTAELTESYLAPLGVGSLLGAPVYSGRTLEGVLSQEAVGPPRIWTEDEKLFTLGVANLISLILEQWERRRVERALEQSEEGRLLAEETARGRNSFERLVGKSAPMQEVYRKLRLAAQGDVTVLLTGESGTGKELAASAVHSLSDRKAKPFVAVNCSAIPEALLESELFGHTKGAFTGAVRDKIGLFQAAHGGTLFLDEVGDMSPALQVKVLRALQERDVRRVGDERTTKVDVRIIAATNRDLSQMVAAGKLREDFYYRIRVLDIVLPPLRERREDIPLLIEHFIAALSKSKGKAIESIEPAALRTLMSYPWPGNIRELSNALERASVVLGGGVLKLADLPEPIQAFAMGAERPEEREDQSRRRIEDALLQCRGSRAKAAKLLGISRVTLWKRMAKLGIVNERR